MKIEPCLYCGGEMNKENHGETQCENPVCPAGWACVNAIGHNKRAQEIRALVDAATDSLDNTERWCKQVDNDASWDSWDHCFKAAHYEDRGGLNAKLRAALAPFQKKVTS